MVPSPVRSDSAHCCGERETPSFLFHFSFPPPGKASRSPFLKEERHGARSQTNATKTRLGPCSCVREAGLNAVPVVGGPLASLVSDYVPTSTQRNVEKTVELLGEMLSSLEGRIDVELVDKEEFSELFKSCYSS
jgi:hypothetical protein